MTSVLFLILFLLMVGILWLRFAPIDPDDFHIDPGDAEAEARSGVELIGQQAPRYPATAEIVLGSFSAIAKDEPNTKVLEGDLDEGMMTFVVRSKVLGLAEVITAKAVSEGQLTKLSIASRPRFSFSGARSRAERLDRWLQEMRLRLGQG